MPSKVAFLAMAMKVHLNLYDKRHLLAKMRITGSENWNAVFHIFGICRYHGNAHSTTVQKCVIHIYTSRPTCVPILIGKCFFPTIFGKKNYVLHNYTLRPTCVPNFTLNAIKMCSSICNVFPHFLP